MSQVSAAEFDVYQSDYRPLQLALLVGGDVKANEQQLVEQVIKRDLMASQSFKALDPMSFLVSPKSGFANIDYGDWRLIGADILALCSLHVVDGVLQAEITVHDPFQSKQTLSLTLGGATTDLRRLAHRVADQIYQAALGMPGYFTTHLLYVAKHGDKSDLIYMDQDGANRQVVGKNFTLLLSPDWSPDGEQVALNTYVGNRPRLEFFNLRDGTRRVFGAFKGLNSTPEFSPDGRFVAATLSHGNDINIHIYDMSKAKWHSFTHGHAIDTTPTWSPDGKWIAFVSNRSGKPQVYRQAVSGGKAELVSVVGDYNTSPTWSPMGDRIAMVSLKNWSFAIATVKPDGSDIRYLATGKRVESPNWSSNGQMLIYSAEQNGMRRVYRVPSWGGVPESITSPVEDASDPAWSRH
ncbi:MAG: Tol-Pal system beta propeller repeat protein TolB [Mariprofundus sp.]|nr:Tol-Pal system beta propeller repeat protein TolB [Mariprofundus sp.]